MKIKPVDDNRICILVTEAEYTVLQQKNARAVRIDSISTFTCVNEPSAHSFLVEYDSPSDMFTRYEKEELEVKYIDITNSAFTTSEFLILFICYDEGTYEVMPCYNNHALMTHIAEISDIFDSRCECGFKTEKATPIIFYYGFKLALATLDYHTAIKLWGLMFKQSTSLKCNCHG